MLELFFCKKYFRKKKGISNRKQNIYKSYETKDIKFKFETYIYEIEVLIKSWILPVCCRFVFILKLKSKQINTKWGCMIV
jgi:hypothetical protein